MAKLAAGREKDLSFVRALVLHGLLDVDVLGERGQMLPAGHEVVKERIREHVRFYRGLA